MQWEASTTELHSVSLLQAGLNSVYLVMGYIARRRTTYGFSRPKSLLNIVRLLHGGGHWKAVNGCVRPGSDCKHYARHQRSQTAFDREDHTQTPELWFTYEEPNDGILGRHSTQKVDI